MKKSLSPFLILTSAAAFSGSSFVYTTIRGGGTTNTKTDLSAVNGIWNTANDFGKGKFRFYDGLEKYMEPFPDEDREM